MMLKEYLTKLIKSTVLQITGFISFVIAVVLDLIVPNFAPWVFYVSVVVISIVFGGFDVFKVLTTENKQLREQLANFSRLQPKISLKLIGGNNATNPVLWLNDLPPLPNIEALVLKEKEYLLSLLESSASNPFRVLSLAKEPNPNYLQDINRYLVEYREYLQNIYECSVDRANRIFLIVENKGGQPASDIIIDMSMPRNFTIPKKHQKLERKTSPIDITCLVDTPRRPNPHIDLTLFQVPIMEALNNISSSKSLETSRPEYVQKDKVHIVYKIDKIVQHTPFENLEPFWIWLGDIESEENWEIPIRITCSELQQPLSETLVLQIRKPMKK